MKTFGTIICLLGAGAAMWLAFTTSMDVSMAGFPDGHVTDYGAAVDTPCYRWSCGPRWVSGFCFWA